MSQPLSTSPSKPRRVRRRLILLGVLVVLVIWIGLAGVRVVQARDHARRGLDLLEQTQADLGPAELVRGQGLDQMRTARSEFDQAAAAAGSPLLVPLKVVPFVGRQVRSVDALAGSAAKVVRVGVGAMEESTVVLDTDTTPGPDRVALVRDLGSIASEARADLRDVSLGPNNALVGPLADARERFARQLTKVRKAMVDVDQASTGLAQMLQGPSKYLVLAANNAEMRAGSGMLLSAGVLDLDNGRFELGPMTDTGDLQLPAGAVPLPAGDFADRWGWLGPTEEWRFLAMSPQFDATARLAADMWKARTGESVDGVLALDPIALRGLVAGSGAVEVDGKTIDKDNVVSELLLQQYLDSDPSAAGTQDRRRERSSAVARAIVAKLDTEGWDTAELVRDLREAADGRHVLAWSSKPEQERAWKAAGLSGRLQPDSLLLAVLNRAGNKLDQFLAVTADLSHRPVPGGTEVTVRITLENQTPVEGLNTFVAGPYRPGDFVEGEYRGIVSANVPGVAGNIRLDGGSQLVAAGPDGNTRVVASDVDLLRGERRELVLRFTLPTGSEQVRVEPSARYPAISWTAGTERWQDGAARTIRW